MDDAAPREIEVKIPVDDLGRVRDRLAATDAECLQVADRETNVLYDSSDRSLTGRGHTLRLRRFAGRQIVTFKGELSYLGSIKVREEHEVAVEDLETLANILERLGFTPSIRYEKDREEWRFDHTLVTLDHTPMGDFVEVEGSLTDIPRVVAALRLDLEDAVQGSYLSLWQRYRSEHLDLALPADMVFDDS